MKKQTQGRAVSGVVAVVAGLALVGCERVNAALVPVPQPALHYRVVCDRSDSGVGLACTPEVLRATVRRWATEALERPGSTLVAVQVGRARDDVGVLHRLEVPEAWGPGVAAQQRQWQEGVEAAEPAAVTAPAGSAVVEAVSVAMAMPASTPGQRVLVLLSDLRQVTPGTRWNFERTVPTAPRFNAWVRDAGLWVDLAGVEVRGCGVHHLAGGGRRHDALADARLRAVWDTLLREAGATRVELAPLCGG